MSLNKRYRRVLVAAGLTVALAVSGAAISSAVVPASADTPAGAEVQEDFAAAARESGVPAELLLAVSYQLTRWDEHGSSPSALGGYGLMHLTDVDPEDIRAEDARGLGAPLNDEAIAADPALHRLDAAATLLDVAPERLEDDSALNIRAGAALLAQRAKAQGGGALPTDLAGWYPTVAWFGGSPESSGANAFADDVYESLRSGVTRTTNVGEQVTLPATAAAAPPKSTLTRRSLAATAEPTPATECPTDVTCRFIPAAYKWLNRNDSNDYGNYDPADRPTADGLKVRYIVIHDTEGSYAGTIASAQNPRTYVSSHYVIRSSDGEITQMLRSKDIGWHAGNWNINQASIGIEHEGVAREGGTWYTEAMYKASAKLVRYLAAKYGIPLDRNHIIGHEDVEGGKASQVRGAHWDPGPFWDWNHYMDLLGAPVRGERGRLRAGDVVTITPDFATNRQAIPSCSPTPCKDLPEQGTNFVFLRAEARADAPLLNDPALQSDGSPGTRKAEDWSDKAVAGRQYVVAAVQGDWVAIWYAGKQAWIQDPQHKIVQRTCGTRPKKITPAAGLTTIPVYGKAFPETYPAGVTPNLGTPLQYTIPAGQQYVVGEVTPAGNYYARFDESNAPWNHTFLTGVESGAEPQTYLRISLNHRWAFVKLSDVAYVN